MCAFQREEKFEVIDVFICTLRKLFFLGGLNKKLADQPPRMGECDSFLNVFACFWSKCSKTIHFRNVFLYLNRN